MTACLLFYILKCVYYIVVVLGQGWCLLPDALEIIKVIIIKLSLFLLINNVVFNVLRTFIYVSGETKETIFFIYVICNSIIRHFYLDKINEQKLNDRICSTCIERANDKYILKCLKDYFLVLQL